MALHKLKKSKGIKPKKRVGRGNGSGKGTYSGRGMKGQKSRSGGTRRPGFEGGQTPLYKQLPTLGGFRNPTAKSIEAISLSELNVFNDNDEVTPQSLVEKKIIKHLPKYGVKILNNGGIEKKVTLKGFLFSASAKKALEKAGCKIIDA